MHFSDYKFKLLRRYALLKRFFTHERYRNQSRLLILSVVFVFCIAMFSWYYYGNRTKVWELIPDDALLVMENDKVVQSLGKADSSYLWQNIRQIPYFDSINSSFLRLLAHSEGEFFKILTGKDVAVSLHQTAKDDFDFIFYAPLGNQYKEGLLKFWEEYAAKNRLIIEKRMYDGTEIYDVKTSPSLKIAFCFIFHKNYFAASRTPYLIEDVVRKFSQGESSFYSKNASYFKIKDATADGKIFINPKSLLTALHNIRESSSIMLPLDSRAEAVKLKFLLAERDLYFSGYTSTDEKSWLSLFENQNPSEIEQIKEYLPVNAALFYHLGMSDAAFFLKEQRDFSQKFHPDFYAIIHQFQTETNFPYKDFTECVSSEIAMICGEVEDKKQEKAVFVGMKNARLAKEILLETEQKINKDKNFSAEYKGWQIRKIEKAEIPAMLFGSLFSGFSECYYTIADEKYLILGSSLQYIKDISEAQIQEENWSKSIKHHQLLKKAEKAANFTLIADVPRFWNEMTQNLTPEMRASAEENKNAALRFESFLLQCTYKEKNLFDTQVLLSLHGNALKQSLRDFRLLQNVTFEANFSRPCEIVRNHTDKSEEIIAQDNQNQIHLLSKEGKIIWTRQVDGKIRGKITQCDLFANGKLQYVFATKNFIYAFDRLGRSVDNFPVELPEDIQTDVFSVLYDELKRKYRFLVADSGGLLAMYEQNGSRSETWRRINLGEALAAEANFIRAGNQEFYLILHQNGLINLLNHEGKPHKGFPVKLNDTYISEAAITENGGQLHNTSFTVYAENGEAVKISLEGKVLKRSLPTNPEGVFIFAEDRVQKRSGIVVRQVKNRLFFQTENGVALFDKIFANESVKNVDYYNFGAHNEMICVFDNEEKNTYIFNRSGNLINRKPVKSDVMAVISFSEQEKQYRLYRVFGKEIFFHLFE